MGETGLHEGIGFEDDGDITYSLCQTSKNSHIGIHTNTHTYIIFHLINLNVNKK